MASVAARRVLTIRRNADVAPIGAVEALGTVAALVANDGQPHELTTPAAAAALVIDPTHRLRVRRVRVEWSTVDTTVPPALSLSAIVNGSATIGSNVLSKVFLFPLEQDGAPAAELAVHVTVEPGAHLQLFATNAGAVAQYVAAYLWGWSYPQTLAEGAGYGNDAN